MLWVYRKVLNRWIADKIFIPNTHFGRNGGLTRRSSSLRDYVFVSNIIGAMEVRRQRGFEGAGARDVDRTDSGRRCHLHNARSVYRANSTETVAQRAG